MNYTTKQGSSAKIQLIMEATYIQKTHIQTFESMMKEMHS